MKVALVEPFYGGSHKSWCNLIQNYSKHQIKIFSLPGNFWKWRMQTSAITLAREINESNEDFDSFLVSDFLDLSLFKNLINKKYKDKKFILYFHENQLTYPWSKNFRNQNTERRELAFININSALVADKVVFNSNYHLNIFFKELKNILDQAFDFYEHSIIQEIKEKSSVISPGIEFEKFKVEQKKLGEIPIILWNHRFEHDKNPEEFFTILEELKNEGHMFKLNLLGEVPDVLPKLYIEVKEKFKNEIINSSFLSREDYIKALKNSHILPVTSIHDFFGISVVEAMSASCFPLLPNRLAYPEHVSDELKKDCIYNGGEELKGKLIKAIKQFRELPYLEVSKGVGRYSIKEEIVKYERILNN